MKNRLVFGCVLLGTMACSGLSLDAGHWNVSFGEEGETLRLENGTCKVSVEGRLSFRSEGKTWSVATARDAALDRLSLVNLEGTVLGYVSFRGDGDRLTIEVLHRAGANFFPGRLTFSGTADFRADSFACRTIPEQGEQVLNFAAGAGDSPCNDSVFAREEDLALRFFSCGTSVRSSGDGKYAVSLEADIDDPALSSIVIEAAPRYYASRWAPGYHPIDRRRCSRAPTGWMSWNTYFDKAGAAENLAEARIGAKYLKPFGLEIWSIESWQGNSLWLPVRDFHNLDLSVYEPQFPEGMKKLADDIRELGFRPGIWMPLYGTGDKAFHDANRDLFLHDAAGKPIDCWNGRYMLDTTNPDALELVRRLARTASREWGYEFFKFDGMANTPRKFERPEIHACFSKPEDPNWFDGSVKALREGIGDDRILLGCMGDFTGTEARYLDASRLGSDVVGCDQGLGENYNPNGGSSWAQMPVKWANIIHQAQCTFTQIFVNNIMFYTDPDTLLAGYTLEKNEAEVMATIIGLPGQLMFAGDKLGTLQYDRMKMIQQVLPVADIHPQNLYPYSASSMIPVWNLSVTRPFGTWRVVALFNFTDAPRAFDVSLKSLGLDPEKNYTAFEFWNGKWEGVMSGGIGCEIPMRTVRLFAMREMADHPQFVGDDRHITQGAVELNDLKWDASAKTYTLGVKSIGGFPFTYFVRVPEGFVCKGVAVQDGGAADVSKREDGLLAVTISSGESQDVKAVLQF